MIWFVFAVMTAAALAALVLPLLRPQTVSGGTRADYAIAVYRRQLNELENEIARGLALPEEAEATRLEIRRRILAVAEDENPASAPEDLHKNQIAAAIITLIVTVGAWQLYLYLGAPQLPDRPYAERQNDPDMRMNAAAGIIAAELEAHPVAEGYRQLGEIYFLLRRFDSAGDAYRKATSLDPHDARAWSRLGESIVMANDGAVVMDAQDAFKSALAHDAHEPRAQFYMGLAFAQIGEVKKAVAIWRGLELSAPPDAPWLPMVRENIAGWSKQAGFDPASVAPAGP